MKSISKQDIDQLRRQLNQKYDMLRENYTLATDVLQQEPAKMLARLAAAEKKMEQLLVLPSPPTGEDVRVQKLYRELNELRLFFGAPTGRPLEDRGVDFIVPYIKTLRLLFQISGAMTLYVEAVRTELALVEYRLERGQSIADRLGSLADSIGLYQYAEQLSGQNDSLVFDLGHYLLLLQEQLKTVLFNKEQRPIRPAVTLVYLEMAAAFLQFDCGPEETDEMFRDAFIISMLIQLVQDPPDAHAVALCLNTALWLWEYPLTPKQKQLVIDCHNKAREVLGDA